MAALERSTGAIWTMPLTDLFYAVQYYAHSLPKQCKVSCLSNRLNFLTNFSLHFFWQKSLPADSDVISHVGEDAAAWRMWWRSRTYLLWKTTQKQRRKIQTCFLWQGNPNISDWASTLKHLTSHHLDSMYLPTSATVRDVLKPFFPWHSSQVCNRRCLPWRFLCA